MSSNISGQCHNIFLDDHKDAAFVSCTNCTAGTFPSQLTLDLIIYVDFSFVFPTDTLTSSFLSENQTSSSQPRRKVNMGEVQHLNTIAFVF